MEEVIHTAPVFCTNCHTDGVPWNLIYEEEEWITKEGIPLKYYSATAICERCNHEVYIPQINDLNVEHRERLYEKFGGHHGTN
jgi:hypothetical protein